MSCWDADLTAETLTPHLEAHGYSAADLPEVRAEREQELDRQCADVDDMGAIHAAYVESGVVEGTSIPARNFWVATMGEEVVGCVGAIVHTPQSMAEKRQSAAPTSWAPAGVTEDPPGVVELVRMSVSSSHQGNGIGKQLCGVVESFASRHGFGWVVLTTGNVMDKARALYEASGYGEGFDLKRPAARSGIHADDHSIWASTMSVFGFAKRVPAVAEGLSHVHVTTKQRDVAASWLSERVGGLTVGKPTPRSENVLDARRNLFQVQSSAPLAIEPDGSAWVSSVGIGVEDLAATLAAWEEAGGAVTTRSGAVAGVVDPWGVPYELVQSDDPGLSHVNVLCRRPDELLDWYETHLGGVRSTPAFDPSRQALRFPTGMQLVFTQAPDETVAPDPSDKTLRRIDHLGFAAGDVAAACEVLKSAGVTITMEFGKFGPFAFAADPSGLWFELMSAIPQPARM